MTIIDMDTGETPALSEKKWQVTFKEPDQVGAAPYRAGTY